MPSRRIPGVGELGLRLAVAFIGVAIAAVVTSVVLSALFVTADVGTLIKVQQADLAKAAAVAAAEAYEDTGWRRANLAPVTELVSGEGAAMQVTNMAGQVIGSSSAFSRYRAQAKLTRPVLSGGRQVGRVEIRFGTSGLGGAIGRFEAQRWRARFAAAAIATLFALAVSIVVARLIATPLETILSAMRARAAGDRRVRIARVRGVGVVRELQEGFNSATDRLDRLERLRRNFVADIAHELRTPVAIMQASHEAMLDGLAEPTPENLGSLRDEVLRLARMVDDLLLLAAAESATLQLTLAPHDLAAIAGDAAASLGDRFDAAGVHLELALTRVPVMCDEARMREVITNLLTNALKFTPGQGNVRLEAWPDGRKRARVRVSDTGVGIPPDDLARVTERFFRVRRSAAMAAGSGIGLTIVAELIEAHGGELEIVSEDRKGTTVTVTLPRLSAARFDDGHKSRQAVVRRAD